MFFLIIFSHPTGRQPNQRLQLHFHKIQCRRHFFKGSTHHTTQNAISTSFFYRVQVLPRQQIPREKRPPGTASTSFAYMEMTCPPCICL